MGIYTPLFRDIGRPESLAGACELLPHRAARSPRGRTGASEFRAYRVQGLGL